MSSTSGDEGQPERPSALWRTVSHLTLVAGGCLAKSFLNVFCEAEVYGLDAFQKLLDSRENVQGRERGLITVCNHTSVVDDPVIWGPLAVRSFTPDTLRWSLGSYDICFKTKFTSAFFTFGQLLPTHRIRHSAFGGLFQPTMSEAIRLLSPGPFRQPHNYNMEVESPSPRHEMKRADLADPFSSGNLTYTTDGHDAFPAPSAYLNRRHAWVHIFPEGKVHQMEDLNMRYLKWGIARLVLESEPCPDVVPMWIEGLEQVMPETRTFPRFIPAIGKTIKITYGPTLSDEVFGDLRERWKKLYDRETKDLGHALDVGILTEPLKYGHEAVELRKELTLRVRREMLKLRKARGRSDEDPKWSLVETYASEGTSKSEGRMKDGSIVKDM